MAMGIGTNVITTHPSLNIESGETNLSLMHCFQVMIRRGKFVLTYHRTTQLSVHFLVMIMAQESSHNILTDAFTFTLFTLFPTFHDIFLSDLIFPYNTVKEYGITFGP